MMNAPCLSVSTEDILHKQVGRVLSDNVSLLSCLFFSLPLPLLIVAEHYLTYQIFFY